MADEYDIFGNPVNTDAGANVDPTWDSPAPDAVPANTPYDTSGAGDDGNQGYDTGFNSGVGGSDAKTNAFYAYIGGPQGYSAVVADSEKSSNSVFSALKGFFTWFDGQKDATKGSIIALGGSFIQGMFGASAQKNKNKNEKDMVSVAKMNAETSRLALDSKNQQLARNQIGNTNFGAPRTTGLIYSNKLAERQNRQYNPDGSVKGVA